MAPIRSETDVLELLDRIEEAKEESARELMGEILERRLGAGGDGEEATDIFEPWPRFETLPRQTRASARGLLEAGWLEARHDGGLLDVEPVSPEAVLVPGWRLEGVLLGRPERALAGCRRLPRGPELSSLVLDRESVSLLSGLTRGFRAKDPLLLVLVGTAGSGKTTAAGALARTMSRVLLCPSPASLLDPRRSVERNREVLRALARELPALVLLEPGEVFFGRGPAAASGVVESTAALLDAPPEALVVAVRDAERIEPRLITRAQATVHLRLPRASLRAEIWRRALEGDRVSREVDVERLGRRFGLMPGSIWNAVAAARRFARAEGETGHPALLTEDLERGATLQIRHRLDTLAERVSAALSLDDLILEEPVMAQVKAVLDAAQVREKVFEEWGFGARQPRGRGLSILFDGEPGTGKTLCAEVLAAELGLPLFRVSMADVLSKWVGETEKNLKRIFNEAKGSHAILLFDEADALFSQRVEVKQAHDRFANMEVNTLLQLMEGHDGICVLTTNLKSGIDKAFERRLSFVLHFPFPDERLREALWAHHLVKEAPVAEDVDAGDLAHCFELSGGSIRNAVIKAAYRAAARDEPITTADLIEGAKAECVAAGKLFRMPAED